MTTTQVGFFRTNFKINTKMTFLLFSGKSQCESFQIAASTAVAMGDALKFSSGYVIPATAGQTVPTAGVSLGVVTSSDSDYASAKLVPVQMLTPDSIFLADVGTGTATIANVGVGYDLAAAGTVDLSASTHKVVTVVGVISASKVLVKFNSGYEFVNIS